MIVSWIGVVPRLPTAMQNLMMTLVMPLSNLIDYTEYEKKPTNWVRIIVFSCGTSIWRRWQRKLSYVNVYQLYQIHAKELTLQNHVCKHMRIRLSVTTSLTHWGRMKHTCVSKLTFIGSDNDLSHDRCQSHYPNQWSNAAILLIGPLRSNCSEILIEIHIFSLKKMHLKISSVKCGPLSNVKMQH